jgi:hypothetical protein
MRRGLISCYKLGMCFFPVIWLELSALGAGRMRGLDYVLANQRVVDKTPLPKRQVRVRRVTPVWLRMEKAESVGNWLCKKNKLGLSRSIAAAYCHTHDIRGKTRGKGYRQLPGYTGVTPGERMQVAGWGWDVTLSVAVHRRWGIMSTHGNMSEGDQLPDEAWWTITCRGSTPDLPMRSVNIVFARCWHNPTLEICCISYHSRASEGEVKFTLTQLHSIEVNIMPRPQITSSLSSLSHAAWGTQPYHLPTLLHILSPQALNLILAVLTVPHLGRDPLSFGGLCLAQSNTGRQYSSEEKACV